MTKTRIKKLEALRTKVAALRWRQIFECTNDDDFETTLCNLVTEARNIKPVE